jgi:hypothetical protein
MRRMMHAAAFLLLSTSLAQAQMRLQPPPGLPAGEKSVLTSSHNASEAVANEDSTALRAATTHVHENSMPIQGSVDLLPIGSDRPYSHLATVMSCSNASPNLWSNYACERAAVAAHINRHVDGQCSCFDKKKCLHGQPSSPCGDQGCSLRSKLGDGTKLNRYRQPFSSLYDSPSESCGTACGRVHNASPTCGAASPCGEPACTSCGTNEHSTPSHPSSALRLSPTLMAKPPRDRLAAPGFGNHRAANPSQDITSSFEARR